MSMVKQNDKKGYQLVEEKVLKAIPCWTNWTRQLRRVYLSLPAFGSSDASIEEICEELGFNYESIKMKIKITCSHKDCEKSFQSWLDAFSKNNDYPVTTVRDDGKYEYRIKHDELKQVYGQYADIISYFHMEDMKAQGKGSDFAMKVIDQRKLVEMNQSEEVKEEEYGEVSLFET
jgi:hypothetical protein